MGNDIVLVDSDSELELPATQTLSYKKQKFGLFKKPFMSSDSLDNDSGNDTPARQLPQTLVDRDSDPEANGEAEAEADPGSGSGSGSEEEDEDEDDEEDTHNGGDDAGLLDSSSDSSEIDMVDPSSVDGVHATRRYLKTHTNEEFLQKYLPETASTEDMLHLMVQLGYYPTHLIKQLEAHANDNTDANTDGEERANSLTDDPVDLFNVVSVLHRVMERVRRKRIVIEDFSTFEQAVDAIKNSSKILVITGAGISTSLGLPDFRSSTGLYQSLYHLGLSDPQEAFDLRLFCEDPSIFYSVAHMVLPPENVYSVLHAFIRVLQSKDKLLRNYTQNIDNLEANIGIDPDKLVQCHGSFASATCISCGFSQKADDRLMHGLRNKTVVMCPQCLERIKAARSLHNESDSDDNDDEDEFGPAFGVMKPDVTFFGEPLPRRFHDLIIKDLHECDLVICVGTSLKVAPVADIVDKVPASVPQILINKDPILHCDFDVSVLGLCDDVAKYICNKLDWILPHNDTLVEGLVLTKEDDRIYLIGNAESESTSLPEAGSADEPEGESTVQPEPEPSSIALPETKAEQTKQNS